MRSVPIEETVSGLYRLPPGRKYTKRQHRFQSNGSLLNEFDRIQVLGEGQSGYSVLCTLKASQGLERDYHHEGITEGHTGCVNALCWNEDGTMLATGSDDFRVCLWKIGKEPAASDLEDPSSSPKLGLGLQHTIHTGHTRNIFSVKWLPHCSSSRIVSAAGDGRVKVFDISRTEAQTAVQHRGKAWHELKQGAGLLQTYRCHSARVKRISIEESPDVFLTCSEDGTVRQFDLREPHACQIPGRATCTPPLADYSKIGISLYTLSLSKIRPELFVCAGTSPFAYLHDRRMNPRKFAEEWGQIARADLLSQCVRKFNSRIESAEVEQARHHDRHITAVKLSEVNGRDLLVSYSESNIFLFDIFGDSARPALLGTENPAKRKRANSSRDSSTNPVEKRSATGQNQSPSQIRRDIIKASGLDSKVTPLQPFDTEEAAQRLSQSGQDLTPLEARRDDEAVCLLRTYDQLLHAGQEASLTELNRLEPVIDSRDVVSAFVLSEDAQSEAKQQDFFSSHLRRLWPEAFTQRESRISFIVETGEDGEIDVTGQLLASSQRPEAGQHSFDSEDDSEDFMPIEVDMSSTSDEDHDSDVESEDSDEGSSHGSDMTSAQWQNLRIDRDQAHAKVPTIPHLREYKGHVNRETVKDVNFGFDDQHVLSGSDDGRYFMWNKESANLEAIFEGDSSVVNVLQPNPILPILAISGIDSTIKIFGPTCSPAKRYSAFAQRDVIIERNASGQQTHRAMSRPSAEVIMNILAERLARRQVAAGTDGSESLRLSRAELQQFLEEEEAEGCRTS